MVLKDKYRVFTFDCPEKALADVALEPELISTDIRMFSIMGGGRVHCLTVSDRRRKTLGSSSGTEGKRRAAVIS